MFHFHIYLHRKLPFLNLTFLGDEEVSQCKEFEVVYKGAKMYEFPDCRVCKQPKGNKIDWLKR